MMQTGTADPARGSCWRYEVTYMPLRGHSLAVFPLPRTCVYPGCTFSQITSKIPNKPSVHLHTVGCCQLCKQPPLLKGRDLRVLINTHQNQSCLWSRWGQMCIIRETFWNRKLLKSFLPAQTTQSYFQVKSERRQKKCDIKGEKWLQQREESWDFFFLIWQLKINLNYIL